MEQSKFGFLSRIASQVFTNAVSVNLFKDKDGNRIYIKLKDFFIKDLETNGIIIDELVLSIENIGEKNGEINFDDTSFVIEKLNLIIQENWINNLLKNIRSLEEHGIHNLWIQITQSKVSIIGKFKTIISIGFSIDLKITLEKNKIKVEFDRFWAGDLISLPRWVQKSLLGILQKYLDSKRESPEGIKFVNQCIYIDPIVLSPVDIYMELKGIFLDKGFVGLKCETRREDHLPAIKAKEAERKRARKNKISLAEPFKEKEDKNKQTSSDEDRMKLEILSKMATSISEKTGKEVKIKFSSLDSPAPSISKQGRIKLRVDGKEITG